MKVILNKKFMSLTTLLVLSTALINCSINNNIPLNSIRSQQNFKTFSVLKNKISFKASNFKEKGIYNNEYIIKFKKNEPNLQILNKYNLKIKSKISKIGMFVVQAPGFMINSTINSIKEEPSVKFFEPNYVISLFPEIKEKLIKNDSTPTSEEIIPNDPLFKNQYAPQIIQAPKAWTLIQKGQCVPANIAIVDTGVDLEHPDLKDKLLPGKDFVDEDDIPMDENSHGTHCAGISAAIMDNNEGITGISPRSNIVPVRVLDNNGSGSLDDVASGILWAADSGVKVISLSLGAPYATETLKEAVQYALNKDIVVLAAMGNSGNKQKYYPAAYEGVTAVSSTDSKDKYSYFTTYGEWVSVSAPGSSVLSSVPGGKYAIKSGTSMACPNAAGVVALIRCKFPELTNIEVKKRLEITADDKGTPGFDIYYGNGRINAYRALND